MNTSKNVSDSSVDPESSEGKSWVSGRFAVIFLSNGVARRKCTFADCGVHYARGTSHVVLKRHWKKAHGAHVESKTRPKNPNSVRSPSKNNKSNKSKSAPDSNKLNSSRSDKPSKNKTNTNTTNTSTATFASPTFDNKASSQNNNKFMLDVKMVSKRLREATSNHLTFDIYTPKKGGKTYGIISAHSVNESTEVKSVLLEYKHLPYPDDSASLFEFLRNCINTFNIRDKIVSITSNCSETVANAIHELDRRYKLSKNFNFSSTHIRCFPQFIHLNVLEVLRSQERLIDDVRKVAGLINNHNFTLRPLQQAPPTGENIDNSSATDSDSKVTGLKLFHDNNRSSWNTTYNMIETFSQHKAFIEPAMLYFPQELAGTTIDWDRLFTLVQFLRPFYETVNKFAMDNYTPVSLVAATLPHLLDHLSNTSWSYDDLVVSAHNFKLQLESYQQEFHNDLTVIATLLDPRVKDTFIAAEGRENAINVLRQRLSNTSLVKVENQKHQLPGDSFWYRVFRQCNYDEISDYLECPQEHGCTNTIAYWESQKNTYPSLYALAKMLVCVQATSVPNDRMFSAAENAERERKNQYEAAYSRELMKSWAKYLEK